MVCQVHNSEIALCASGELPRSRTLICAEGWVAIMQPKLPLDIEAPPAITSLRELAKAEHKCTRCPLQQNATQAVPGEGRRHARLMLVGEQPGDKEDIAGKPFVGPAGRVLDRALAEAAIPRAKCS